MSTAKSKALKVAVVWGIGTTTLMLGRSIYKGELSMTSVLGDLIGGAVGATLLYFWERRSEAKSGGTS